VLALAVAVAGLVLREVWQAFRARREQRARDRAILSALLRELSVIAGTVLSVTQAMNREHELLTTQERWSLKPLLRFPTSTYDLVKPGIPSGLLKQERAVPTLVLLQAQCEYANALAQEYQRWKTPEARGQPDQVETIWSFHGSVHEAVTLVANRCNDLTEFVRAAGEAVGGLNLEGPPQRRSRLGRILRRAA
jgi:hypothetical protein